MNKREKRIIELLAELKLCWKKQYKYKYIIPDLYLTLQIVGHEIRKFDEDNKIK